MGRGDYALVRDPWFPSALTEGLFMMIPEQEAMLASPAGRMKYAAELRAALKTSCARWQGDHDARRTTHVFFARAPPLAKHRGSASQSVWQLAHSPHQHFRVHFRPSYRARATLAAAEAERAYTLLASELHPPRGIVDITLSDDVDTRTASRPSSRRTASRFCSSRR